MKGMPVNSGDGSVVIAAVNAISPTPSGPPTDLSTVAATNIQVKFRQALPSEVADAEHAYIDITRANGSHQTIGAYPVGGTAGTSEGGQLTFQAGAERNQPTKAEMDLHPPHLMSLTQYANSLVEGAKAYNAHPVRYDGLGEDGFNSNSFVSSLIAAKGGSAGLADIRTIVGFVDTSPVRTYGQRSTMNDSEIADLVQRDLRQGRVAAPGFGHAAIQPERFTDAKLVMSEKVPSGVQVRDIGASAGALVNEVGSRIAEAKAHAGNHREGSLSSSTPPYLPGGTMHIRYAGDSREVGAGFRQSGTITKVDGGIVTQNIGNHKNAEYKITDLTSAANDPDTMQKMLVVGRHIDVRVTSTAINVQSLDRDHDLDREQRLGRHGHER